MMTFLAVTALFMVMFGFMALALWFARYKQEGRACCSTGIEELLAEDFDPCLTCPRKDSEECNLPHDHADGEVCEHHGKANVDTCALENGPEKPVRDAVEIR